MTTINHKKHLTFWAGALALAATRALAQQPVAPAPPAAAPAAEKVGLLQRVLDSIPGGSIGAIVVAIVVLLVATGLVFLMTGRRRGGDHSEDFYTEPTNMESSKFEQLLAETQGLYLRIHGGESKGYYRKIEQLARIFMERIGIAGARQLPTEDLLAVLNSGSLPQKQAGALLSILERCKQGAEHESDKIDVSAADLIKDLRLLVKQAAEETASKQAA